MSDPAAPTEVSTGAQVASNNHGETVNEVATGPKVTEAQDKGKGKGKAVEAEEGNQDDDDDDDSEDSEGDDDDDDDELAEIEPDEVDPTNISSYGVGMRPSRNRKPIDYSSEEAMQKAGLNQGGSAEDEDEDQEFKGDVSMDG